MKIRLETHDNIILIDPTITVHHTIDDPINETFTTTLRIVHANYDVLHNMPAYPYVNGTWQDSDVQNAINDYLPTITIE